MLLGMSEPKIILFDIETLANLREVMKVIPNLGDYPGLTLKASINSVICFGYKYLGGKRVNCINAWDFEKPWKKNINDDYHLLKEAYEVLKEADAVVTHNGKRFDWKFIQTRLLYHGFPPLPKIRHIDTCEESKKNLFMFNNRLNTVAKFLTDSTKMENGGWDLWVDVSERKPKAMKLMEEYCKQDVLVLEKVFNKLRPVIKGLPNRNIFKEGDIKVCPGCGSENLRSNGYRTTTTRSYKRYICVDCKSWCTTDVKDKLPRSY